MKTLTLVVFTISCSLSQLPGSLAVSVQAGKSKDTLRTANPSQLSSAAKECVKSIEVDDTVGHVNVGEIDGAFQNYFYNLSTILDLDVENGKKAGDCLLRFRNHNANLTSCWSSFVGVTLVDDLKKVYDNFYSNGFPNVPNSKVIDCYWKKDATPNNYGRFIHRYEELSHEGGICVERVLHGNLRDCGDFDKEWKNFKTETGIFRRKYYNPILKEDRAREAVENCFSAGEFCGEIPMPEPDRFRNQGSCVTGYMGAEGLRDMKNIAERFSKRLSQSRNLQNSKSELIECAQKD